MTVVNAVRVEIKLFVLVVVIVKMEFVHYAN